MLFNQFSTRVVVATAATAGLLLLTACNSSGTTNTASSSSSARSAQGGMSMSTAGPQSSAPLESGSGTPASGPHTNADVTFATDMIPHHAQAVAMADLATTRATTTAVRDLAVKIKAGQAPEIAEMSGWLTGWSAKVPSSTYAMGSMGSMSGSSMPGMMSDDDMTSLGKASGTAFDRMWLTMMISHHEGAVTMAKTELTRGQNADVKKLAQSMITSQSADIVRMKTMLAALPS